MAKMYYEKDCDLNYLNGKKIAVIGYGSQGHAHALNLKDSGCEVCVGLREGSKNWAQAEAAGLTVKTIAEAAKWGDVVMMLINDEVLKAVEDCTPLAPLHNPANIIGIEACRKVLGDDVPQVAVFDTAFHQTMPEHAYLYSIPYKYYENDKLRRYGFHGTSHRYVTLRAAELLGKDPKDLKIVSCHLGNGSSLAAVDGGKCVDTSMGLTPLAGLPMGTRAGDMDVGVIEYVANKYDRSISSVMEGLNKRSGMMGLSGVSSDFRDLEAAAAKGHHRSAIALRIFEYRVHKMIAEYAAAMNGVDVVVFTAGVGENAPSTRAHILEGLEFMGITCDEEKNDVRGEERIISKDGAPVTVMVIPTNEELMIAQDTLSIVEENKNK